MHIAALCPTFDRSVLGKPRATHHLGQCPRIPTRYNNHHDEITCGAAGGFGHSQHILGGGACWRAGVACTGHPVVHLVHTPPTTQGTGDRCNEFAPTLRASALFLGRPLLADSWLRAVNASGLGNTTISYTAFLSVQWALNPDSCSVMAYNRTFRSYKPVTEPRAVANTTACCQLCKVL